MSIGKNLLNYFDSEVEKLLHGTAEDEDLQNYEITKAGGGTKGDGYLGVITAIEISGTVGSKRKELHLVVKSASKSDALRIETPIADVFQREIYMYNTVIPVLKKFQMEKIQLDFTGFAKCYKATIIDKSEALVLENLNTAGYKLWDRRIPMNEDHVALVMGQYGRFHALAFGLRDQEPEKFAELAQPMTDVFVKFVEKNDFTKCLINQCYKAEEALDPLVEAEAEVLRVFKRFVVNSDQFVNDLPLLVDHYSVFLHGDCWTNNMMFAYDDVKNINKPTKVCLIDLQLSRLGPPVLDLAYFFYCCGSKDIISNFKQYMDIYYNSLSDSLKKLGSDPKVVYPYSVFRRQWTECSRFGLLMSLLVIKIMMSEQNEVTDLADAAESGQRVVDAFAYDIGNVDEYNDRARHIILHFVNNRFI